MNAVIGHSQHGFMRAKSCSLNLISFYNRVPTQLIKGHQVMKSFWT